MKISKFIDKLLRKCKNIKVITTCRENKLVDLGENKITLQGLSNYKD
jgi:hypothetical protein